MKPALIKVLLVGLTVLWPTLGLRAAVGVCNDNFPDGVQSHSLGQIDFGYNAQLQGSPDARLHAGSITSSWWSWWLGGG